MLMKPLIMKKYLYILSIFCTLLCSTCSYEDIVPENPCANQEEVKAIIEMAQYMGRNFDNKDTFIVEPTDIFSNGSIRFDALIENAKYTWILGAETLYTKSFIRNMSTVPPGQYQVTLIVQKTPNKTCFPRDNGMDTFTRVFSTTDEACSFLTNNSFKGVWVNESADSFEITIANWNVLDGNWTVRDSCRGNVNFVNLNKGVAFRPDVKHDTIWGPYSSSLNTNTFVYMRGEGVDWQVPHGFLKVNPVDTSIEGTYSLQNKTHHFKGRLIK